MEAIKRLRVFSADRVQDALTALPATLDETYSRILSGLESQREVFTALQWLAFSARPIEPIELAEACIVDPGAEKQVNERKRFHWEQLSNLLPSLVIVTSMRRRPESKWTAEWDWTELISSDYGRGKRHPETIRLAHFSVREFLVSERITHGKAAAFSIQADLANSFIVKSCVVYITYYAKSNRRLSKEEDLDYFPLLKYSCENWHQHYRQIIDKNSPHVVDMLVQHLISGSWVASAHNVSVLDQPLACLPFEQTVGLREDPASMLYYAAYFGFEALVGGLLKHATVDTVNARGGLYGTALQAASRRGDERIVRMLLQSGADANITTGKHGTALQAAAKHGFEDTVQLLLSNGANIDAKGGRSHCSLCVTISFNQKRSFRLLLDKGADCRPSSHFEDSNGGFWESMVIAIYDLDSGNYFVDLILKKTEIVESEAAWYNDLLFHAIRSDRKDLIKLMLDAGIAIDGLNQHGQSALYRAAWHGEVSLVQRILESGANVNAVGGLHGTALQAASVTSRLSIVKMLLENEADVNIEGGYYGTALQAAVVFSKLDLEDPDEIDVEDIVAPGTRWELVELLLDHDAHVNAISGRHGTACQAARHSGYEDLVNLLVARGADPELVNVEQV